MQIRKRGLENKKTRNLIGQTFNFLTVYETSEIKGDDGRVLWNCKCKCGQAKRGVKSYDLRSGKVKSCGCILHGKNNAGWRGYEEMSGRYWNSLKSAAKRRNIPFNLSMEEAWEIFVKQNRKCAITGLELKFGATTVNREATTASIDRIDSKAGYRKDNIQWVHKWINIMKWDLTTKEFIDMCKLVVNYNK